MSEKPPPKEKLHPLKVWLDRKSWQIHFFTKTNGLPFNAIYQHLRGALKEPKLNILLDIEDATKREVTVQDQADWWRKTLKKKQ